MRILGLISKIITGILAITSAIATLVFNDTVFMFIDSLNTPLRYLCVCGMLLVGIFLVISTFVDAIMSYRKKLHTHRLKYQSKKFIKFFTKWYSQPGTVSIVCDDLDWTTDGKKEIYEQLLKKSAENKLKLYLSKRGCNSNLAQELRSKGAKLSIVSGRIIEHFNFSCVSIMENPAGKVIVRTKNKSNNGIVIFDEINNTYVTTLLNNLLNNNEG